MGVVSPVAVYDDGSWCSLVTTTPSQRPANKEDSRSLLNTGKAAPGRVFVLFLLPCAWIGVWCDAESHSRLGNVRTGTGPATTALNSGPKPEIPKSEGPGSL